MTLEHHHPDIQQQHQHHHHSQEPRTSSAEQVKKQLINHIRQKSNGSNPDDHSVDIQRHFNYYGIVRNALKQGRPTIPQSKVLLNRSVERVVMSNLFINNRKQKAVVTKNNREAIIAAELTETPSSWNVAPVIPSQSSQENTNRVVLPEIQQAKGGNPNRRQSNQVNKQQVVRVVAADMKPKTAAGNKNNPNKSMINVQSSNTLEPSFAQQPQQSRNFHKYNANTVLGGAVVSFPDFLRNSSKVDEKKNQKVQFREKLNNILRKNNINEGKELRKQASDQGLDQILNETGEFGLGSGSKAVNKSVKLQGGSLLSHLSHQFLSNKNHDQLQNLRNASQSYQQQDHHQQTYADTLLAPSGSSLSVNQQQPQINININIIQTTNIINQDQQFETFSQQQPQKQNSFKNIKNIDGKISDKIQKLVSSEDEDGDLVILAEPTPKKVQKQRYAQPQKKQDSLHKREDTSVDSGKYFNKQKVTQHSQQLFSASSTAQISMRNKQQRRQKFNELMNINWNDKIQKLSDDISHVISKEKKLYKQKEEVSVDKKRVQFQLPE